MQNNIKSLRIKKGYSSTDLAQMISVSNSYICKIEKGVFPLTSTLLKRLNKVLDCTTEDIIGCELEDKYEFNPKDVTFKNNHLVSIHRWYPYIEGYSENFVKNILTKFNQNAVVYDPFNGSGTTMLTAAYMGYKVIASEINPLMRFIANTKVNTVKNIISSSEKRENLISMLKYFNEYSDMSYPKVELSEHINNCYIHDNFFEVEALNKIAFIKSVISTVKDEDIQAILKIALASIIVESSNMIRAADLRRRTDSEFNGGAGKVIEMFKNKLKTVIDDIISLDNNFKIAEASIISDNAKTYVDSYEGAVDLVITSPPYINGTNYFRNTKLELWILDFITSKDDLRKFRSRAITAGINNVSKDITTIRTFDFVEEYASQLDTISPDKRIPKMIRAYFSDMDIVFSNIAKMLKPSGKIYFDIGDSEYYGIHIPVDDIIERIAKKYNLIIKESLVTRNRKSKKGTTLTQKLLVFEKSIESLENLIVKFKDTLPYKEGDYAKRNWGSIMHSLCSYQGKLRPSIAFHLIKEFTKEGQTILDPFSGIGTIPLEACLNGRKGVGVDINPIAYANTLAKVSKLDKKIIESEIEKFSEFLNGNTPLDEEITEANTKLPINNGVVSEYYHVDTLKEILLAKRYFMQINNKCPEQQFLLACMLHILHGNRPYALSKRSNNQTPLKPRKDEVAEYKSVAQKLKDKATRMYSELQYDDNFTCGEAYLGSIFDVNLTENSFDAIITSPPFASSTRFYSSNWLRLWFCGWGNGSFNQHKSQFIDYKQEIDFNNTYKDIFNLFYKVLVKDGLIILHLGKTQKIDMGRTIKELLSDDVRFDVIDLVEEDVSNCNKHGLRDQGATTDHQFLFIKTR
jgi:tRNA G10  N-methylase Trm11/DNA-binding XRE family transcriptional regulator